MLLWHGNTRTDSAPGCGLEGPCNQMLESEIRTPAGLDQARQEGIFVRVDAIGEGSLTDVHDDQQDLVRVVNPE